MCQKTVGSGRGELGSGPPKYTQTPCVCNTAWENGAGVGVRFNVFTSEVTSNELQNGVMGKSLWQETRTKVWPLFRKFMSCGSLKRFLSLSGPWSPCS